MSRWAKPEDVPFGEVTVENGKTTFLIVEGAENADKLDSQVSLSVTSSKDSLDEALADISGFFCRIGRLCEKVAVAQLLPASQPVALPVPDFVEKLRKGEGEKFNTESEGGIDFVAPTQEGFVDFRCD